MKLTLPYQQVQDVVCKEPARLSAAEAHGVLTGMLCVCGELKAQQWLSVLFDEGADAPPDTDVPTLIDLCEQTRQALQEDEYTFELFLPDDGVDLHDRAAALAEWCQGFLYGVGFQGGAGDWPDDTAEVLGDLVEISRLDSNVDGEADEVAFAEINEFVRIAVQMVRQEFSQSSPSIRLH
ncbi:UPF0149 family protein [Methyloterricola oryzae]|uniref:UPF0149 family protein n=1 Tax=Methyloterricola oryzae TaxID=1495050 RepID=UPI0005EB90D4|nr:UPF0149 family protein [Methyloterricola oryzae]